MMKQEDKAVSTVNRDTLVASGMALLLLVCLAGSLGTAYWALRFGLAPRPPLSAPATVARFVVVIVALLLWRFRRDLTERSVLGCAVLGAGASGLYGVGVSSTALQVVRLLFHFLGYSLGVVVIVRWFRAKMVRGRSSVRVPTT
jgi:hypothetical protein